MQNVFETVLHQMLFFVLMKSNCFFFVGGKCSDLCFCPQIRSLFREEYGEVYTISVPTRQERTDFFQDLILHQAAEAPPSKKPTRRRLRVLMLLPVC